jgi:hypothetical protein
MVGNEHDHRSNHRYEYAPQVYTRNTYIAECMENRATDDRTDDSQEQIPHQSLAPSVHELTADVAGNQPDDQPRQDTHRISYMALPLRLMAADEGSLQECISRCCQTKPGGPLPGHRSYLISES